MNEGEFPSRMNTRQALRDFTLSPTTREKIERAHKAVEKRVNDPNCSHEEPPKGLTDDEVKRGLVLDEGDREAFDEAMAVIQLRGKGCTYTEIENETGVNRAHISRILNNQKEWLLRAQEKLALNRGSDSEDARLTTAQDD
ncbi:hypothetical protein [Halomontanus rarus]|uniref:hypothetical protein n=1 Tax=Halomontanus rarus TaxID=3034020 RepID=UPI001A995CFE